jgi:ABC-2 type transport system permease protein
MIGLLAFITEDVAPFEWIYQKLIFILGGLLIPIDFYPEWLQALAKALPFSYMMYGPARLFVSPDMVDFLNLIGSQFLWILLLGGVLTLFFRLGTRRLAINGG